MNPELDRRRFLAWFSAVGASALLAPRVWAQGKNAATPAAIAKAETLAGITFTGPERELMAATVEEHLASYGKLRQVAVDNAVAPAFTFSPLLPGRTPPAGPDLPIRPSPPPRPLTVPTTGDDLAFLSLVELGALLRERRITSVDLTRHYLGRLKRFGPRLHCVITLTEARAMEEAHRADRELARGTVRGPLHGIPYGIKDLFDTAGIATTWGARPFEHRVPDEDSTVVRKLGEAGAVLAAKLSVGALAWGDVWFGGMTRNPFKLDEGSSGSSAGPASAVAAGLVGFTVGTETLGSIISPSQQCGATGLRPTYGRVSRHGCMALSWTMDKAGPICRTAEDCALVLDAIRGSDGKDAAVIDAPFPWDASRDPRTIRVGVQADAFDPESEDRVFDQGAIHTLRALGWEVKPVRVPDLPVADMLFILEAEAAAAFDTLTLSGDDELLTRQGENSWPNVFRAARLIPAVEYIQANRARSLLIAAYGKVFEEVDVYLHPTYDGNSLLIANLTGQPAVAVRSGFRKDGTPASVTFTGPLFREADLLLVAKAYQDKTGFHRRRPALA